MDKKIFSFIFSIIMLCLSVFLVYLCFTLNAQNQLEGFEKLALVVTIPVYIIFYCLMFGSCITSVTFSIKSINSSIKAISIISIIILVLAIATTSAGAYSLIQLLRGV